MGSMGIYGWTCIQHGVHLCEVKYGAVCFSMMSGYLTEVEGFLVGVCVIIDGGSELGNTLLSAAGNGDVKKTKVMQ